MNVRQLEAFRAVMETGSFTRAAEMLRISQPAVSKLLNLLARDCGFNLFHRHGNQLIPSPEAEMLHAEVERMLIGTEAIARRAADIREMRFGQLTLAAFPAFATRSLPRIITKFRDSYPGARILLTSRSSRPLVEWVASQHVEIGIGLLAMDHPGVRFEHFLRVEGVCALPPGHRLTARKVINARDLQGEPFISLGTEDRSRFLVDQAFENRGVHRNIIIEAQQSEAACSFVASGAGVSIVEPFSASEFDRSALVLRRFRPTVFFDLWLLFPAYRQQSRLAKCFLELLAREVPKIVDRVLRTATPRRSRGT